MPVEWLPGEEVREITEEVVRQALEFYNYNRVHTARGLGISVRTIRNYIRKYNICELGKRCNNIVDTHKLTDRQKEMRRLYWENQ